jgi:hypothetical protein
MANKKNKQGKANKYEEEAKKKKVLDGNKLLVGLKDPLAPKGSIKTSVATMLLLGGVVAVGGLAGAAAGRKSLYAGIIGSGLGYYFGSPVVTALSAGMMASNVGNSSKAVSGVDGLEGLEGAKERMKEYAGNLKSKLFLDKLKPQPKTPEKAAAMGEVQYFNYPQLQQYYSQLDQAENSISNAGGTADENYGMEAEVLF